MAQAQDDVIGELVALMRSPRWAAIKQRMGGLLAVPAEQRQAFEDRFGRRLVMPRGMSGEDRQRMPERVEESLRTGKIHPKLATASKEMLRKIEFQ